MSFSMSQGKLKFNNKTRPEYNCFLSPDRLCGRNNVTSDKVNFRPDIRQNIFWEKKTEHKEFVWLLMQLRAVAPW